MSVTSLEEFEQKMIYPLPEDDKELTALDQVKYFLNMKTRKREIAIAKREMDKDKADHWLRKRSGKPNMKDLTRNELEMIYEWLLETLQNFTFDNLITYKKNLIHHFWSLGIFESESQSCGMKDVSKLRQFISSHQKKNVLPKRRIRKQQLSMKNDGSCTQQRYVKECGSPMKRLITKSTLAGGGVMYTCFPDASSNAICRPNTAPVGLLPNGLQNNMKAIRQRSSKKLLSKNSSNLPFLQLASPKLTKAPLLVDNSDKPEVDS